MTEKKFSLNLQPPSPPKAAEVSPAPFKLNLAPPAPPKAAAPLSMSLPAPKPLPPPPPPKPKSRADYLLEEAIKIDAHIASDMWFKARIEKLIALDPSDWMNWGESSLKFVREFSDKVGSISHRVNILNTTQWITDTLQNASKPKASGIMAMFSNELSPAEYEAQLTRIRGELDLARANLTILNKDMLPIAKKLRTDVLVLQVASMDQSAFSSLAQTVVDGRLRSLIAGQQTMLIVENSASNLLNQVVKFMQEIDQLMSVTIPAWKLTVRK